MADKPNIEPVYLDADKTELRFNLRGDAQRGASIALCDTLVRTLEATKQYNDDKAHISLPLSPRERDVALSALRLYWLVLGRNAEEDLTPTEVPRG
jgi:hypothetical protein